MSLKLLLIIYLNIYKNGSTSDQKHFIYDSKHPASKSQDYYDIFQDSRGFEIMPFKYVKIILE